jgi:hypothetical protein
MNTTGFAFGSVGGAQNEYHKQMERVGGAYFGGGPLTVGGGYFGGGADAKDKDPTRDLRRYRESLAHATKEKLYRGLASALSKAGVPVDADASPDEIVRVLKEKLPSPRKNGNSFKDDAKSQEKICKDIAGVLNDEFTPGAAKKDRLIDASLGAVSVCRQVSELVYSMSTGLHSEFLEVHASLKRVVRNLEIIDEILSELHGKSMALVDSASLATGSEKKLTSFDEVYRRTSQERDRQMKLLRGFLNVTLAPAKEELALAMRDNDESHAMIKKLKLVPGTGAFADSLAEAVSGLGTVAAISARVDKALKEVSMGIQEYLESSDIANLGRELDSNMMGDKDVDLSKFLKAVKTLKENFYRRGELELGAHVSGISGAGEFWGGDYDYDDDGKKKSKYDRRIEKRTEERKLIVKEFINKTTRDYNRILSAVKAVGPKLGKEVPISDKLKAVRDAIAHLGQVKMGELNLELALIGFFDNAAARQRKERFISGLEEVKRAIEDLMSLRVYASSSHYFAPMLESISSLVRTISYFSDVVAKKYGAAEAVQQPAAAQQPAVAVQQPAVAVQQPAVAVQQPAADTKTAEGGAISTFASDLEGLAEVARAGVDLDESVNAFLYYYYVAQIYANLRQTHKELEHYGEKYVSILGDAVADRIIKLGDAEKDILKKYVPTDPAAVGLHAPGGLPDKTVEAEVKNAKLCSTFVKKEFKCKREFYKALQAVDMYMKVFTDAITANPDDASEIKGMLDGVEVIGRWFVDKTGDDLAKSFDCMRAFDAANGIPIPPPLNDIWGSANPRTEHYYTRITDASCVGTAGTATAYFKVGVPQLGVDINGPTAKTAVENVSAVYNNFQALKNIINAFARIGSKFGNKDIAHKVFMSPTQIFKALTNYLKCSALSIDSTFGSTLNVADHTGAAVNVGSHAVRNDGVAAGPANLKYADLKRIYFGSIAPGADNHPDPALLGDFVTEGKYFVYCIKAMAAKVLTVIGVSDMFNRPSPAYDLTPTRIIIGAGEFDTNPEVKSKAAELYFRLPRLAEFYRRILGFDNADRSKSKRIALLPELEGVFSGLIRLEFLRVRPDSSSTGNYSESELQVLIREVNKVFDHYSGEEEQTCTKALTAFVAEINRRYGVVKQEEWDKLMKLLKDTRDDYTVGNQNQTNYAILPGEEDFQTDRRAPSDRYLTGDDAKKRTRVSKFDIDHDTDWTQWEMLKEFREKIDTAFNKVTPEEFTTLTYSSLIDQARKDMDRAKDEHIRYRIASELIQGSGSLAGSDVTKTMMFHETVVVGLNTLGLLQRTLTDIRQVLIDSDVSIARKTIKDWINENVFDHANPMAGAGAGAGAKAITLANITGLLFGAGKANSQILENALSAGAVNTRAGAAAGLTYANIYTAMNQVAQTINAWLVAGAAAAAAAPGVPMVSLTSAQKGVFDTFVDTFVTYIFNSEQIMRNLLQAVAGASSTFKNIASVRFPHTQSAQLIMDFSGAASLAQNLMGDVRYFIDLFRPHIPKSILNKFEGVAGAPAAGSYYWLEENLMDTLISGKSDDYIRDEKDRVKTLAQVARSVNDGYVLLVGRNASSLQSFTAGAAGAAAPAGNLARLTAAAAAAPVATILDPDVAGVPGAAYACLDTPAAGATDTKYFEQYGHVLSALIFYDAVADANSGIVGANVRLAGLAVANANAPNYEPNHYIERLISSARPVMGSAVAGSQILRRSFYNSAAPQAQLRMVNSRGLVAAATTKFRVADWAAAPTLDGTAAGTTPGLGENQSLVMMFNQIVEMYLRMFVDPTSGKIYRGLIDSIANGSLSQAVMSQGYSLPDIATLAGSTFGRRGDPTETGLLSQTLAMVIQRLMVDSNPTTQISDHLLSTLSEVPQYVRENYRANLPGFSKLFGILQSQSEFYKQVLSSTQIHVQRLRYTSILAGIAPTIKIIGAGNPTNANSGQYAGGSVNHSIHVINGGTAAAPSDITEPLLRLRFTGLLNGISSNCYTCSNATAGVMRELADEAKYFQTQENSIQDYRARYNKFPIMPLSLVLAYAHNDGNVLGRMLPQQAVGTSWFKFEYGTRKMLGRPSMKFGLDDAPGVRKVLDGYNATAGAREKIDAGRYEGFMLKTIQGMQFFTDVQYLVGAMLPSSPVVGAVVAGAEQVVGRVFQMSKTVGIGGANNAVITPASMTVVLGAVVADAVAAQTGVRTSRDPNNTVANGAYSVAVTAEQSINVVESSNQRQSLLLITKSLAMGDRSQMGGTTREIEQVANIIDMNIMPLNVHALMRTIPLAPLYNYAYTFDQEIALMFGEQSGRIAALSMDQTAGAGGVSNTREVFLKMLQDPLCVVPDATYGTQLARVRGGRQGLLQRIFRGDDSLGMGRPKFISDQLFNKALFGSMIPTSQDFDETGPPGAGRMEANLQRVMRNIPGAFPAAVPPAVMGVPAGVVAPGAMATWGALGGPGQLQATEQALYGGVLVANARSVGVLTYLGAPTLNPARPVDNQLAFEQKTVLKQVQLGSNALNKLRMLNLVGKARFDTTICRQLFFLTNVQRVLRQKMNQELTQYRNVLVSNHRIVNPSVTEYGAVPPSSIGIGNSELPNNRIRDLRALYPANEISTTRQYDNETRLVS